VTYLLDTDTCSFALKRRFGVAERLRRISPDELAVCTITLAEAWAGAARSADSLGARRAWDALFQPLAVLPFDEAAAQAYAVIRPDLERRGAMIGGNDCLIAAVALSRGLVVVTGNLGEFSRVHGLRVESWGSGSDPG
jgi:tRNA(fMet)-specific endonuclease VapC